MRIVLACVALSCFACSPPPPTRPLKTDPPVDVAWRTLVRDRQTAQAYSGRLIRFRVDAADCAVEGAVVKLWYAHRGATPPVVVVTCLTPIPDAKSFVVVGTCGAPVVDGVKRGVWIDFSVPVTDAFAVP